MTKIIVCLLIWVYQLFVVLRGKLKAFVFTEFNVESLCVMRGCMANPLVSLKFKSSEHLVYPQSSAQADTLFTK